MWNVPTEKMLAKLPVMYSTEEVPVEDKKIHMHFFIGGCDWYIAEWDAENRLFFGYANLNDSINAEWGCVSLDELKSVKVSGFMEVDRDKYWKVRKFSEIKIG